MKKNICLGLVAIVVAGGFYGTTPVYAKNNQSNKTSKVAAIKAEKRRQATVSISGKNSKYENEYIEVDINIPVIKGMNNKKAEETLNKEIENNITNFKRELETSAKEEYDFFKKLTNPEYTFMNYVANTSYKVNYNKNNILSFTINYSEFTGGAHGMDSIQTYNIDLVTGKKLELKDLFKKDFKYKERINKDIKSKIETINKDFREQQKKSGIEDMDKFDLYCGFEGIKDNQDFYIKNGNIVIYFGRYEIAPYSEGIPEFKISVKEIKNNLSRQI